MGQLEILIKNARATGQFHLTCWQVPGRGFQANFSRNKVSWSIKFADDPITAICLVLSDLISDSDEVMIDNVLPQIEHKKKKPIDDDFKDLLG